MQGIQITGYFCIQAFIVSILFRKNEAGEICSLVTVQVITHFSHKPERNKKIELYAGIFRYIPGYTCNKEIKGITDFDYFP